MESEIWSTLHTARIANAGFFIFTIFLGDFLQFVINLVGKIIWVVCCR